MRMCVYDIIDLTLLEPWFKAKSLLFDRDMGDNKIGIVAAASKFLPVHAPSV